MTDIDQHPSAPAGRDPVLDAAFDWILDLKAAPADPDLRAAFEDWLVLPGHAEAYRWAEEIWGLTGAAGRPVRPLVMPPVIRPSVWRRAAPWVTIALAASIALAFFPGICLLWQADYRTAAAETRAIRLPDGSVMTLDGDSAAALHQGQNRRGVDLLAGRAFFEVTKDPLRSFVVSVGDIEVTVHGTAFDVLKSDRSVTVAVAEGSVSVAGRGEEARLGPGDQAVVDLATAAVTVTRIPPGSVAAWRQGQLIVSGATIAEIVDELRRYHAGMILLPESDFATRRVAGAFDLRDPLAALRGLTRAYGGDVVALTPYLLVVKTQ